MLRQTLFRTRFHSFYCWACGRLLCFGAVAPPSNAILTATVGCSAAPRERGRLGLHGGKRMVRFVVTLWLLSILAAGMSWVQPARADEHLTPPAQNEPPAAAPA